MSLPKEASREFVLVYATQYPTHTETVAYKFPSAEACSTWQAKVDEVKRRIAQINDGPIHERLVRYQSWLEYVEAFRLEWGDDMIPRDIQVATNGVQKNTGVPETNWLK